MSGDQIWLLAVAFGAIVVGMDSWVRFDEPSYDSQAEYFSRYKPRFSTSSRRYWRAKWGYIAAILLLFFLFALVPGFLAAFTGGAMELNKEKFGEAAVPLAAALVLLAVEKTKVLNDFERKLRGFLHAFARIPDCIRRTVAQMKSSPFNFTPRAIASLTHRLGLVAGRNSVPAHFNALLAEDDLLHTWCNVGALLTALSEQNRDRCGIDLLFFESYRDELDSMTDRHIALVELVRQHLAERAGGDGGESSVPKEIRDLRDRLYAFIACGVHSSVKTDAESLDIIKRLGFAIRPSNERKTSFVAQLAGFALMALLVVSAFTSFLTSMFRAHVVDHVDAAWQSKFPIPADTWGIFAWSWTTALFYFSAILAALALRNARVAKRQWFDITNFQRERPILRYIWPTLIGTAVGALTLTIIALNNGPTFNSASFGDFGKAVVAAISQVLPWVPLATVMAFVAVTLSDSRLEKKRYLHVIIVRAVYGGAAMAVVGFLTAEVSVFEEIGASSPAEVARAGHYLCLFIAALIGLFAFVLCVIAQVAERYTARARCFVGQSIEVSTRQGAEFRVSFQPDGTALLLSCRRCEHNRTPMRWHGEWERFPEGTAVKWNIPDGESCRAGEFGLISWYGDSLIYEGYAEGFGRTPDFLGQVHVRTNTIGSMNTLYETARSVTVSALPASAASDARVGAFTDPNPQGATI
jgi:hypothetical protein